MPWPTDPARAVLRRDLPRAAAPCAAVAALLAAALLAAGCTTPPPQQPTPPAPPPPTQVNVVPADVPAPPPPAPARDPAPDPADAAARSLVAYHERLRTMGTPELAREYLRLGDAGAPPQTLELALLLAQRRANGDLARALALLEPLLREDAAASPYAAPARLLHARLAEQRRLEEQLERQGQQLREQQRRIEQLTSQLEALRAIERSLTTRPLAPAPAVPPAPRSTP